MQRQRNRPAEQSTQIETRQRLQRREQFALVLYMSSWGKVMLCGLYNYLSRYSNFKVPLILFLFYFKSTQGASGWFSQLRI